MKILKEILRIGIKKIKSGELDKGILNRRFKKKA
jgi:hypothetical protein